MQGRFDNSEPIGIACIHQFAVSRARVPNIAGARLTDHSDTMKNVNLETEIDAANSTYPRTLVVGCLLLNDPSVLHKAAPSD